MDNSYIVAGTSSTTFVGPDAVQLFAAMALRMAINLYLDTGLKANRAYTPTAMRAAATRITGKPYTRAQLAQASADIKAWSDAMKAALPVM